MSPWISHRFLRGQSDERLMGAAARGNPRAFEMLVERHRASLLAHARRMLGVSRAEDALQQGLLQAWVALQRGITVRNPRAWLFRVVHNSAVDTLRSARPEQAPLSDSVRAPAGVEADVELHQSVRDTLAGVAALPDLQREALLATALDGHSHEHVGSALGVSADAVRGLVYRARTSLRAAASALVPPQLVGLLAAAHRRYASLRPAGSGQGGASQVLLERGAAIISAGALAAGVVAARGPMAHHPSGGPTTTTHAGGARETTAKVPGAGTVNGAGSDPSGRSTLVDATSHAGSRGRSRTGTPRGSSGEDQSAGPGSAGTGLAPDDSSEAERQTDGSHDEGREGSSGSGNSEGGSSRSGEDGGGGSQEGSGSGSGTHESSGDGGSGSGSGDGGPGTPAGSDGGSGPSIQSGDGGESSHGGSESGSGSTDGSSSSGGSGGGSVDGGTGSHDGSQSGSGEPLAGSHATDGR